ncbi:HepT-like ribonuclease domain-containing protein [Caldivirga sp.]
MECSSDLETLSRLRNLLVHRYWIVKDDLVYESLKGI